MTSDHIRSLFLWFFAKIRCQTPKQQISIENTISVLKIKKRRKIGYFDQHKTRSVYNHCKLKHVSCFNFVVGFGHTFFY